MQHSVSPNIIPIMSFVTTADDNPQNYVTTADDNPQNCAKCLKSEQKHTGKIILWKNEKPYQALFGKLQKATISFVMSARQHGTTRSPLVRFS
jgi:hypothetical protein